MISVVVPCYHEEENIVRTYREIKHVLEKISTYRHEIIFVDNGSADRSAELLRELAQQDPAVVAILLSRNFGPEASGFAGCKHARGDAIIIIPADLQDPPSLIPVFLQKWEEGFDVVQGQAMAADEHTLMRAVRRLFYAVLKKVSYVDIPIGVVGFGLLDAQFNREYVALPERNRFGRGLIAWLGFRRILIPYRKERRKYGRSSYTFLSYLKHAESGLFSFTTLPLDIITYLGMFLVILSVVASVLYLLWVLLFGNPIAGSATLFFGIMFFGGAQILAVSIVGKYVGIIFEETKRRPFYIVREIVGQNPPPPPRTLA